MNNSKKQLFPVLNMYLFKFCSTIIYKLIRVKKRNTNQYNGTHLYNFEIK